MEKEDSEHKKILEEKEKVSIQDMQFNVTYISHPNKKFKLLFRNVENEVLFETPKWITPKGIISLDIIKTTLNQGRKNGKVNMKIDEVKKQSYLEFSISFSVLFNNKNIPMNDTFRIYLIKVPLSEIDKLQEDIHFLKKENAKLLQLVKESTSKQSMCIHKRVLFNERKHYNENWTDLCFLYSPFGYANFGPSNIASDFKKKGWNIKWVMYAIYSDNMMKKGETQIRLHFGWKKDLGKLDFSFPLTWGSVDHSRDMYSRWISESELKEIEGWNNHASLRIRTNGGDNKNGSIQHIEIQTWVIHDSQ